MSFREINFDGLIGPSHNYAGLSFGNVASATNAGNVSSPRQAALQGVAKMRRMLALGLAQGILLPHDRPCVQWLKQLGFTGSDDAVLADAWRSNSALLINAFSASPMWTANAATVSPAPDCSDGRCHLTVANLSTMLHRSLEADQTERQLRVAFGDGRFFAVHSPLPSGIRDEGAANTMRVALRHADRGLEIFVYGENRSSGFPARQHPEAGAAIARRHGLAAAGQLHIQQNQQAIAAGAFHNDVVAVANERVLFAHELAFQHRDQVYAETRARIPRIEILEAPASRISLQDAVSSYLFNSQLVTLPDGSMALIVPAECREVPSVWEWLTETIPGNRTISSLEVVEVRESMRNGGGPACLRLRVQVSEAAHAAIDQRFLVEDRQCDLLEEVISAHWPKHIAPSDLGSVDLWAQCRSARAALLASLGFAPEELQ